MLLHTKLTKMKANLKKTIKQRRIIDQKIQELGKFNDSNPPSGWIKAVRVSLGLTIRQLADIVGVTHGSINQIEKREPLKRVSLASLEMVADAMDCKLVYAIIPKESSSTLEQIVYNHALKAAEEIITQVDHTMKLESQGTSSKQLKTEIKRIAKELMDSGDPLIWETSKIKKLKA